MTRPVHPLLRWLVPAVLAASACAHAPVAPQDQAGKPPEGRQYARRLLTGSRIPQWVDARSRIPATTSPVHIYTHEDVVRTGKSADLAAALEQLDLSVQAP